MASVIVKRVKCGDSSTIRTNTDQMIVDCGSNNRNHPLSASENAYQAVAEDLFNKEYTSDLMITHFDNDHFNGLFNIMERDVFRNIFLPYSIIQGGQVYSGAIGRLLTMASPRSWGYRLSNQIILLFEKLEEIVEDIKNIKFVKAGDTLTLSDQDISILWPKIDYNIEAISIKYPFINIEKQDSIVNQEDGLVMQVVDDSQLILSDFNERLIRQFDQVVSSLNENELRTAGKIPNLSESAFKLSESINDYLNLLHSNNFSEKDYIGVLNQLKNARDYSYEINNQLWNKDNGILSKNKKYRDDFITFGRNQYHELITNMNALSIIFHNTSQKYVFLGDAAPDIIEYLDNENMFEKSYEIVKVQHHGTDRYFTSSIPAGGNYIISNGGNVRRKVSERNISMFECRNAENDTQVYCTNAHQNPEKYCEYFIRHQTCSLICIRMGDVAEIAIN